jgi:hypothetical protein
MANKKEDKSVFDVSKPGSTAPSSSSKPIIVSHKPLIKDSTLVEDVEQKTEGKDAEILKAPSEKAEVSRTVIKPPSDIEIDDKQKGETETKTSQTNEQADKESDTTEKSQEAAVVDAVISQTSEKKQKKIDQEEAEDKKDRINKLVESKQYFVKVRQPKSKRNKRAVVLLFLLLLATFVGFVIAADAEVIDVKVPVDFIKKQQPATETQVQTNVTNEEKTEQEEVASDENDEVAQIAKANDSERQTDVKDMALKAEEYYAQLGTYPADISALTALAGFNKEASISPNNLPAIDGGNVLGGCTLEPSKEKNDHYCYVVTSDKGQFEIWYFSETENRPIVLEGINNVTSTSDSAVTSN